MYELFVYGETLPEAYHNTLRELKEYGTPVPCPDYNTSQIEASMTMVVASPLQEPMISKLFTGDPRSLEQYCQEIIYGILDFEVASGKWEYTYHDRIADQIGWLIDELKRNPYSRRAVLNTFRETDLKSNSPPCLMTMHFFIREGKLCLKATLRSNDATRAAFMNAFAFICLQEIVAKKLGVEVGQYVQRSESYHVYESEFNTFNAYCGAIRNSPLETLTYNYKGDWEWLMDDERPAIAKMVEERLRAYEDKIKKSIKAMFEEE